MPPKKERSKESLRGEAWIRLRPRSPLKEQAASVQVNEEKQKNGSFRLIVFFLIVTGSWIFLETYRVTFNPFSISKRANNLSSDLQEATNNPLGPIQDRTVFASSRTTDTSITLPSELRVIRLATWNLGPLDFDKITDERRSLVIADMLSQFDIIAIQGIRSRNRTVLDGLVYLLRERGLRYACLCASWDERTACREGIAFLFNTDLIETDGEALCEIVLPGWNQCPAPLVGSFRTVRTEKEKAFTFYLINIQLAENTPSEYRDMLYDVYDYVRGVSGRQGVPEDDVIMLGTFGAPPDDMGRFASVPNLVAVHANMVTDLRGCMGDNIVFNVRATSEYVERFGVVDLKKMFSLSPEEEAGIADHRPVWADFSVRETANRE